MENNVNRNQVFQVDTQKKFLVKFNIAWLVLFFSAFFGCMTVNAQTKDAFAYMTEIHIGDYVWQWKGGAITVEVAKDEAVNVQCNLNFTKLEWESVYDNGKLDLAWKLPDKAEVVSVSNGISAKLNDKWTPVGNVDIAGSQIRIEIEEAYRQQISGGGTVDFQIKMLLRFPKGEYQLTDDITVIASDIGGSKAEWSYGSILVNVIDIDDESKLLGNARVEIEEAQYGARTSYGNAVLFQQYSQESIANNTFLYADSAIVTIEDKKAEVKGGFVPGNLYYVRETVPPVGYVPVVSEVKVGFYYYDGKEETGNAKKYAELNEEFAQRYENEGAVAVLGAKAGYGEVADPNVWLKNKKIPAISVQKIDALTKKAMKDVQFTLQIAAAQADYTFSEYQKLGWTQDSGTQTYQLPAKTDKDGKLTFAEGSVPYCSNLYELVETVPKGYEGYGGTKITRFRMKANEDGTVTLLSEDGENLLTDDGILLLENEPVADVEILKVNEEGKTLSGAVFALYGETVRTDASMIEKSGKNYYEVQQITTGKDGVALFSGLKEGTYYLVEKEAPKGYIPLKDSYKIEVTKDILKDGKYTVKITNKQTGTPIINTGGRGIKRYFVIAFLLLAAGGVMFVAANKKKFRKMLLRARRRAAVNRRKNSRRVQQRRKDSGRRRQNPGAVHRTNAQGKRKKPQGKHRR